MTESIQFNRKAQTPARFPGKCCLCSKPIGMGDLIVGRVGGGWAHIECVERFEEMPKWDPTDYHSPEEVQQALENRDAEAPVQWRCSCGKVVVRQGWLGGRYGYENSEGIWECSRCGDNYEWGT